MPTRFSTSSQRRPRSFKEIQTLLPRRVYARLSMMGIFRQSDGVLLLAAMTWIVACVYVVDPERAHP